MSSETQISMFDMLDQYETTEIQPEEQKKGVKGWIIEGSGIFLRKNGSDHDFRGVCTRPVVFEQDTRKDRDGRWWQAAHTTKGPYGGWYGGMKRVFRSRPSWADCLRYARETHMKGDPDLVEYYEIIGNWAGVKREW